MNAEELIPAQSEGASTDVREQKSHDTVAEAKEHFKIARERLLNVCQWDKVCELPSSKFILLNENGAPVYRHAQAGDYFKIDIPAPGNAAGDGFDWVQIEELKDGPESGRDGEFTAIRVRPCSDPFANNDIIAHFFKDSATSTFIVSRQGTIVSAEVHGRNEKANIETGNVLNNMRNALIGWGAKLGFSFPQWKSLVAGIVK